MAAYLLRNCSKKAGAIFSNGLSEQVFTSQEFIHRCFGETASTATRSTIGDRLFLALDVRRRHSCKARLLACCFLGYLGFKVCFSWWLLVRELRFFTWFSIQEISFTTTRVSHCCAQETAFIEWQRLSSIGMTSCSAGPSTRTQSPQALVKKVKALDCKTVRIFADSKRASSQTKGLERGWKQRARLFSRLTRLTGVQGSRASHLRLLRYALPISLLILKKTRLFCSLR